jgi:hypothetical protein
VYGSLLSKKKHKSEVHKITLSDAPMTLCYLSSHRRPITQRDCFAIPPPMRASYSQQAVLRVSYSEVGAESMMLSAHPESIILLVPPAESMMLSARGHDCELTLRTHSRAGGAESIILSAGRAETIILSAHLSCPWK